MNERVVGGLSDLVLMLIDADLSHAMWLPNPHMKGGLQI